MPESPGPVAINHDRLLENFVAMLSVDSFHGDEDRVEAIIRPALEPLGIRFSHDAIGNLIGCWPGRGRSDGCIMLNAHMDTVRPTPNMRPVVEARRRAVRRVERAGGRRQGRPGGDHRSDPRG